MKYHINLLPYFQWLSDWIKDFAPLTVSELSKGKFGELTFTLLSEWLEKQTLPLNENLIGKEVWFSFETECPTCISYDTYLSGCIIKKETVTDIDMASNTITIGTSSFSMQSVELFDKVEYCLLSLHYDGCDIFVLNTNGDFKIAPGFTEDLYEIKN